MPRVHLAIELETGSGRGNLGAFDDAGRIAFTLLRRFADPVRTEAGPELWDLGAL